MRQFAEKDGDYYEITRRLKREDGLGMTVADYYGTQKHLYSYEEFYAASTDKRAGIFFCLETMKEYVPCSYEMQEYVMEPEKQHNKGKAR